MGYAFVDVETTGFVPEKHDRIVGSSSVSRICPINSASPPGPQGTGRTLTRTYANHGDTGDAENHSDHLLKP